MALAIEPMITLGSPRTVELADGWTVVTRDGSVAAHVEHTMALLDDGVWVLTAADGGRARLGDLVTARQPADSPRPCAALGRSRREVVPTRPDGGDRPGRDPWRMPQVWRGGGHAGHGRSGRDACRRTPTGRRSAERLRAALDEGRLDLHEYDERLQRTYAAKTYGDLDGLLDDLPATVPPQPGADRAASISAARAAAPRRRPSPDGRYHGNPAGWPVTWGSYVPWSSSSP